MKWFLMRLLRGVKALLRLGARPARRPVRFKPEFAVLEDRSLPSVMMPAPMVKAVPPQGHEFSPSHIVAAHSPAETHGAVSALPAAEIVGASLPVSSHAAHQVPVVNAGSIAQVFAGLRLNHDLDGLGQGKLISQTGSQAQNPLMPSGTQQEAGSLFGSGPVQIGPGSRVGFSGNAGEGDDEGTGIPGFGSSSGLESLNQALNREGLPGLTFAGGDLAEGKDVDITPTVWVEPDTAAGTTIDIPADGKKGSVFEYGGRAEVTNNGGGTIDIYANVRVASHVYTERLVSVVQTGGFDPNPADDGTTSGPGKVHVDGNGNLPPIGGKVDGENKLDATMKGRTATGSQFATLAHLSQRSGQGSGSSPGVVGTQGHINPNPEGGDNNNPEDAGNLKTIRFQGDGVLDPIPSPMLAARLRSQG
jgi:hypothetical protein